MEEREELTQEETRILDLLAQGLSREFPNPLRVGAPTLPCLEASLSARYDLPTSSNGWIISAPAARAIKNSLSCVSKRYGAASGRLPGGEILARVAQLLPAAIHGQSATCS